MRPVRKAVPNRGQPVVRHLKQVIEDPTFKAAVSLLRQAPIGYQAPKLDLSQTQPLPDEALTQRIRWLTERIRAGERILDLGCGRWEMLYFLGRKFPGDHLGLEREPEFLERCRHIGVRAISADFNNPADPALRFACSQEWDVVLIIDSIVYWRYPAVVLAALQDRCKRMFVTVNNAGHLSRRLQLLAGNLDVLPNIRGSIADGRIHWSMDWFSNRWTVRGFQIWCEALGFSATPVARRSVTARYLPLGPLPSLFARSTVFELTPQSS